MMKKKMIAIDLAEQLVIPEEASEDARIWLREEEAIELGK